MDTKDGFYQKQRRRQHLKNGFAIVMALLLIIFVFVVAVYVERTYTKDAASDTLINLKKDSFATLISSGKTTWAYSDSGSMPAEDSKGRNWKEAGYDTSDWKAGKGSFGTVEGKRTEQLDGKDPVNLLNYYTENRLAVPVYYFRTEFNLKVPADELQLNGTVQFDDAVVIYLNGTKIYEANVPEEGFDGDGYGAKSYVNDALSLNFTADDLTMLKQGRNVIAVEIHQAHADSSDVYFDFQSLQCQTGKTNVNIIDASSIVLQPGAEEDSVIVNWLTRDRGNFKLQFAKKADFMKREVYKDIEMKEAKAEEEDAYCYTAVIEDMEPGEEYVYRIASEDKSAVSKQLEYQCKDAGERFSFLFAGDSQIGASQINDDAAGWQKTLDAGYSIDYQSASFIISAGDQVDSSDEQSALREYFAFRSPEALRSLPVAVVRGNHETDNELYDLQFQWKNQNKVHDYYFTYGDTLFLHINSNNDEFLKHRAFLQSAISKTKPRWIVVMMHYSLYGSGPHAEDCDILKARNYYAKCFKDLDVDLVLSGHDHLYSRSYLMNGKQSTRKDGGEKKKGETLYLTGNSSSGSKFYQKNVKKYSYLAALNARKEPYITSIKVSRNEMIITTYDTTHLDKIDYCKIRKQ